MKRMGNGSDLAVEVTAWVIAIAWFTISIWSLSYIFTDRADKSVLLLIIAWTATISNIISTCLAIVVFVAGARYEKDD